MIRMGHLKKLNQTGFDHILVAVFIVVVVGIIGTYAYVKSNAASPTPVASPTWSGALSEGSTTSKWCLEYKNGVLANKTPVVLDKCNNNIDQKWTLGHSGNYSYKGKNYQMYVLETYAAGTHYCVDNWHQSNSNGAALYLYTPCAESDAAEQFVWAGPKTGDNHELMNPERLRCIDDLSGQQKVDNEIDLYNCKQNGGGTFNQDWWEINNSASPTSPPPSPSPGPTPPIVVAKTGEIAAGVGANMCLEQSGATVILATCLANSAGTYESWNQAKTSGAGVEVFQNAVSHDYLGTANQNAGTDVTMFANQNSNETDWTASNALSTNTLTIGVFAQVPCLDAPSGSSKTPLVLAMCSPTASPNQTFTLPVPYTGSD